MRLDHVRLAGLGTGGLDDVRIDGALREPGHILELRRFLIEHLDEHAADDLALGLGVRFSAQSVEKALLGIDPDDAYAHVLRERRHHLIALAEPQQSVIDEYAS